METLVLETIAVEKLAVEVLAVEAFAVETLAVDALVVESLVVGNLGMDWMPRRTWEAWPVVEPQYWCDHRSCTMSKDLEIAMCS